MKQYKIGLVLLFLFCGLFSGLFQSASANSGGPPLGNTAAPNEQNCTSCHSTFSLNSGRGRLAIVNLPNNYNPGQSYLVDIILDDPDAARWGFQLTNVTQRGESAGTIRPVDPVQTQLSPGSVGGSSRSYLMTTIAGNFSGTRQQVMWRFEWTAPNQNVGTVTFHAASVAADSDGSPRGDRVYTASVGVRQFEQKPLAVNFINPNSGSENGGTMVTLRGQGFREGLRVLFGGEDGQARFVDETTATAVTPPGSAGRVDVRVVNPNGESVTLTQAFTYSQRPAPAPVVNFVSPDRGPTTGGQQVRVGGDNFRSGARVIWNGREVASTFLDQNFLTLTTPVSNPGAIKVVVINPDGQMGELNNAYTYEGSVPPPAFRLLSPNGGEVFSAGGPTINIDWEIDSNGTPKQRLLLSTDGGATFPIEIASGLPASVTEFKYALPEDVETDRARVRLEVVQGGVSVTDESARNFKVVKAPKIERLLPATTKAGTAKLKVEILGQEFQRGAVVEMDGVRLKATVASSTNIKIKKFPTNSAGAHFIVVRNPDGGISRNFLFTIAQ
ncbi:MAG: IPT/TIG domain-containing protein [Blastocatellia bacterium]|nr:IPT/TIG domain-containing protein [Blastocatellia bacterium]